MPVKWLTAFTVNFFLVLGWLVFCCDFFFSPIIYLYFGSHRMFTRKFKKPCKMADHIFKLKSDVVAKYTNIF